MSRSKLDKPSVWARIEQSFKLLDLSTAEFMWRELEHVRARIGALETEVRALTDEQRATLECVEADPLGVRKWK